MASCPKCADSEVKHTQQSVVALTAGERKTSHTVLLLGNPNVGKSTLFNTITGARQSVCNAPGTTVELFSGYWKTLDARVIDMPGTYSLLPNSPDEEVVVSAMTGAPGTLTDSRHNAPVDLVICVLDATSLARSLYLLGQAAQTGIPVVCAVTMQDIAEETGENVDCEALAKVLGVPVIPVDPRHKRGLRTLEDAVAQALVTEPHVLGLPVDPHAPGYNEGAGEHLAQLLKAQSALRESDLNIAANADCGCEDTASKCCADDAKEDCCCTDTHTDKHAETMVLPEIQKGEITEAARAAQLFDWIDTVERALGEAVTTPGQVSRSDKVDRYLLNPWIGIPVFMVAMYVVFWLCNTFAAIFQDPIEGLFDSVGGWEFSIPENLFSLPFTSTGWPNESITLFHAPSIADGVVALFAGTSWAGGFVQNLLIKGLLTGVGVVASFAPLMIVMFLAIAFMEDSGYMARVAFLGDRIMRTIGLDGRVIMPFVVGFGCNLPTLAALRTLPNTRQRIMAVILTPYITCNARMVVYIFIARIFFPAYTAEVIWIMYFASVLMVILGGLVLRPIFLKGEKKAPLMLVLPPYQQPRSLILARSAANRTWAFLRGAGRVIVVMTVVIWVMMVSPVVGDSHFGEDVPPEESLYGYTASAIAPVFAPAGFNDWHLSGALISGFVAKETMLGALATTYQAAPGTCSKQETELADTYKDMSDEETLEDVKTKFAEKDPLFAGYKTEREAYDAVQRAFEQRCVGLHLGSAEDDSTPTANMETAVRSTFLKTTGSPARASVAAFAFLIFVLTYTPCMATVAEQRRQLGWRRTLGAVGAQLVAAWILAVLVYQIGSLLFA